MKRLRLYRFASDEDTTIGCYHFEGEKVCFSLEDEYREEKVAGETRIPAGIYPIGVRHDSPAFSHLDDRWDWHNGMLHIQNIPNFEWVYIHSGNTDDHTEGCPLTGFTADLERMAVGSSRKAYEKLYKLVWAYADLGQLEIEIIDGDR